jgi:hypothetical protein
MFLSSQLVCQSEAVSSKNVRTAILFQLFLDIHEPVVFCNALSSAGSTGLQMASL